MRSSIILTSLLASLALANPVDKRYLTTKFEVITVYTTVTEGAVPTGYSGGRKSGGRHRGSSDAVTVVPTSALPSSVEETLPSSVEEAPTFSEAAPSSDEAPSPTPEESAPAPTADESAPTPTPEKPAQVSTTVEKGVSASPPAASSAAPSSVTPIVNAASSSYGQKILDQHNIHRVNHTNTGPLAWSDQLAATALKIANSCVYAHDTNVDSEQYGNGQGYGQNIGAGAPPEDIPAMITNGMYNDEAPAYEGLYGQDDPDMSNFHAWGHFSQIVWRNTKQVGCATVKCDSLRNTGGSVRPYFTVCNYFPPGNFGGQYTNVGTRLGKPTVSI